MAPGSHFLFLLLLLMGGGSTASNASSPCKISCSTDYRSSINCSCSAGAPAGPVRVRVNCSDEEADVVGECSVTPPRSWCRMLMEDLELVASVGTQCRSTVSPPGGAVTEASSWELADVVKPAAPFNVSVTRSFESFNVTWSHDGSDCLLYNLCIQESSQLLKVASHCFPLQEQSYLLERSQLQHAAAAAVQARVQARMCDFYHLRGPWSEWSPPVAWRVGGAAAADGETGAAAAWCFVSLPVVFLLGLVLLAFLHKPCWQKKLEIVTFVPKPDHFFKPLYQNYQGNFKDWVRPVFSEYDYFSISPNLEEALRRKSPDVLHWSHEEEEQEEEGQQGEEVTAGRRHSLQRPLQDEEGGSQGTGLSIHTVTLSGEEFEEDASMRSFSSEEEHRGGAEAAAQHGDEERSEEDFPFHLDEAERASLDSFASVCRRSEDGYPQVDLDTIDSGFGECGSPAAASRAEQDAMFSEQQQSNYVKQWMISSRAEEELTGSDGGLQDAQTLTDSGC